MYVYHWPITLVLVEGGATVIGPALLTVLALTATTLAAVASWYLVEAPALRRKHAAWVERTPGWVVGLRTRSARAGG
jgi:peptidoglycan/LPS O-acetylase OafA/YrhL